MPVLLLLAISLTAGVAVALAVSRYPRPGGRSGASTLSEARRVGAAAGRHAHLRAIVDSRLDPAVATGLALTLALVVAVAGGLVLGLLAYLVRTKSQLIGIDHGVATWGNRHASPLSMHFLNGVTQLGNIYPVVIALCIILVVAETIRERSIWVAPFVVAVIGGEEILVTTVKQLADRVRPAFNPAAATLGPSFPSGHSATAAAFYAAAALLLGRWRARPSRAVLAGLAVALAVAVASSRVLLDVHWLSDVLAGLALGWAWFAVCAIAFGGRILRFGAAAETAARAAEAEDDGEASLDDSARKAGASAAPQRAPR